MSSRLAARSRSFCSFQRCTTSGVASVLAAWRVNGSPANERRAVTAQMNATESPSEWAEMTSHDSSPIPPGKCGLPCSSRVYSRPASFGPACALRSPSGSNNVICGGESNVMDNVPVCSTSPVVKLFRQRFTLTRGRSGTIDAPNTETQICALGPPGPWLPTAQSGAQKYESASRVGDSIVRKPTVPAMQCATSSRTIQRS